uniref:Uncharacterized protein n=1 Tax=Avena sativa TaxID=4498 RepID=A0ACD5UIK7_AVESA
MAPIMMMMASPAGRTAGGHVRSASVPSQRHPLLTHVDDQLRALRSWTSDPGQNPLALAHVRALLCVLDELLQHCYLAPTDDRLLDGFLALADAYGSFLAALLALRQNAAELRTAVRRRDQAKLACASRAQRRAAKELAALAAAVARCAPMPTHPHSASAAASSEVDVARTVAEAIGDTAAASASVFLQVASLADGAALAASSPASSKKKHPKPAAGEEQRDAMAAAAAVSKLQELEQCVGEVESESEKVFRSLLQTRVSLLNIHTPTI